MHPVFVSGSRRHERQPDPKMPELPVVQNLNRNVFKGTASAEMHVRLPAFLDIAFHSPGQGFDPHRPYHYSGSRPIGSAGGRERTVGPSQRFRFQLPRRDKPRASRQMCDWGDDHARKRSASRGPRSQNSRQLVVVQGLG
jgi:hypothetical protein